MILLLMVLQIACSHAVQIIVQNRTVLLGDTVTIPCHLVDRQESVTQISWQLQTAHQANKDFLTIPASNGPQFINGHKGERFKFVGNVPDQDGSFQITNVSLQDEGIYTCIFILFPSGDHREELYLNVLVPPSIGVVDNPLTVGDESVCLAKCVAVASKPPAKVNWLTSPSDALSSTTNSTQHENGTTTTTSYLFGVPSVTMNQKQVQCSVAGPGTLNPQTLPATIQIFFGPQDIKIYEKSPGTYECVANANPSTAFQWSRDDKTSPLSTVVGRGPTLKHGSGGVWCTATNQYGSGSAYLFVSSPGSSPAGWVLFTVTLILLLAMIASLLYFYKSGKLTWHPQAQASPRREMDAEVPLGESGSG